MKKSKYSAQLKHIKENYVQFKINIKPDVLESFKQKCKNNDTTPTTAIKKFINEYLENTDS